VKGAVITIALLVLPAVARAQRGIDLQLFRPAMDSYGVFSVERAETAPPGDFGFRLWMNLAGNPLRLPETLVERQLGINVGLHVGVVKFLQLSIDFAMSGQSYTPAYGDYGSPAVLPIARTGFYADGAYTNVPPPDAAANDARVGVKLGFFRKGPFGMGINLVTTLPLGDDSAFLGDSGFTFRPNLLADVHRGRFTLAINVGAIIRETTRVRDLEVGHELTYGLAIAYRVVRWAALAAEGYGYLPVGGGRDYTMDVLGGVQLHPKREVTVMIGAGAGVLTSAARRDEWRAFLGITWAPQPRETRVQASLAPAPLDGDPDSDQDGVPDRLDRCPNESEDRDGWQDDDGCPEPDNDGDGVPDLQDKCPNDPEDRDGFADDDGCPDADNDGDGIADAADRCPNEPETINRIDDEDGCPDSGGIVIAAGRVDLPDPVMFAPGRATLDARAEQVLARVADRLHANPQVRRVRIEGHADDAQGPKRNQLLSQQRADAVREHLMRKGIEASRLAAVGYGSTRLRDKNNRRVELVVVEQ
jgi:outer membrane protein OmpA-like peptidoglycan-associated protein